jgi:2-phosphoglycerate kinase
VLFDVKKILAFTDPLPPERLVCVRKASVAPEEEMIVMTNQAEDAMTPIFLIAGSPGVGKSTIGGALAGKLNKSLHIPKD